MAKFGQTWWGKEWLNTLTNIDYSNRLPRGRRYAGNGSVIDIKIKDNVIKAKVQGTRRTPYRVEITIPLFSQTQKNKLIKEITANPLILSKLINRELPVELFELSEKNNIQIFPDTWEDLEMNCSCPDWAVPCKHIAAVVYIIANEIDKNPFLIFNLHGVDILQAIENKGFVSSDEILRIPQTKKYLNQKTSSNQTQKNRINLKDIDFSKIPELKDSILSLLEDETIFSAKNFKTVLKQAYTKSSKRMTTYLNNFEDNDEIDFFAQYEKFSNAEIIISNDLFYLDTILFAEKNEKHFSKHRGLQNFILYLNNIPSKYIERLSPHLKSIYFIYHFSLKLVQNSAYIPQILQLSNEEYIIRQIPALMNEEVKKIFDLI